MFHAKTTVLPSTLPEMLQRVRRLRVAVARTSTAIKVNFDHVASRFRQSPVLAEFERHLGMSNFSR